VPVLNIFSGKKTFGKKQTFSRKLCGGKYFSENFSQKPVFSPTFSPNLPKTHVIKLFSQNGPFASHFSDKFAFFSKKLRKSLYFAKILANVYIFVQANFSQIFSRKSEDEYFLKPYLKGSLGFWSRVNSEIRSKAELTWTDRSGLFTLYILGFSSKFFLHSRTKIFHA
jgi:hypothetical protein